MWASRGMRFWAGDCICRRLGRKTRRGARRRGFPKKLSSRKSGNWRWIYSIKHEVGACRTGLCLAMRDTARPRSFARGWKSEVYATQWASRRKAEFRERRVAEGQRLEEGSLARGVQRLAGVTLPRSAGTAVPRICRWKSAAQGNLATGGVAGSGEGTDQILLLRSAGQLHTAPPGAHHQVPVEDRTRLPPVEGRAGPGSLRRKELERLAPSRDPRDAGALLPDPGDFAP